MHHKMLHEAKEEDLYLRVLPVSVGANKRRCSENVEPAVIKKGKVEKFDRVFGDTEVQNRMTVFPTKNGEHQRIDYHRGRSDGRLGWQNQPWQRPGPWAHPPGPSFPGSQGHFNSYYKPLDSWQNSRHSGPMNPNSNQFHGNFYPIMDPRRGTCIMGPMAPNGQIKSQVMPNGPFGPREMNNSNLPMSDMGRGSMIMNGPMETMTHPNVGSMKSSLRISSPFSSASKYEFKENRNGYNDSSLLPIKNYNSVPQNGSNFTSTTAKPNVQLEKLTSVSPSVITPSSGLSYSTTAVKNPTAPAPVLNLNMDELFQKLVETGIVADPLKSKKQEKPEEKKPEIIPVSFDDVKSLRVKHPAVIKSLFNGTQCGSCGLRFVLPEQKSKYSQHLDWHFRQNRKSRLSRKKGESRLFYYKLSDWLQYGREENLDDNVSSWFEKEKKKMQMDNAVPKNLSKIAEEPSVPIKSVRELRCFVCHDEFTQFYHEEMEEWHIKPAVTFEGNNIHTFCLEDHKRNLQKSAEALGISTATKDLTDPKPESKPEKSAVN